MWSTPSYLFDLTKNRWIITNDIELQYMNSSLLLNETLLIICNQKDVYFYDFNDARKAYFIGNYKLQTNFFVEQKTSCQTPSVSMIHFLNFQKRRHIKKGNKFNYKMTLLLFTIEHTFSEFSFQCTYKLLIHCSI